MATATASSVKQMLNKQLSNWSVLYVKLHHVHWYVTGHHFFDLHEKFEEYYDEANGYIDDLAERLLSIGGKPASTMKEYLELASVKEADGNESPDEMVRIVIRDFETIIQESKAGMETAENEGDEGTSDMLLGIVSSLEKHCWMLKAYLA